MKKTLPALFLLLLAAPALAQTAAPAAPLPVTASAPAAPAASPPAAIQTGAAPDTSNVPFIQGLRSTGATIYYLGNALGMNGWFAIKDRQVQIFYTTPDNTALLVGALLSAQGENISQQQLTLFAKDHPELVNSIASGPLASAPPASIDPASPSQQVFTELANAATVTVGKPNAPQLIMVMDVNCPHCHKTWKMLEKAVDDGALRVTLVPVPALGSKSAQEEAVWLAAKDPQEAWKKHASGDDKIFTGEATAENLARIASNMQLIQRWKITQTPTLLYHGKNGKVRVIQGAPDGGAAIILNDLGG